MQSIFSHICEAKKIDVFCIWHECKIEAWITDFSDHRIESKDINPSVPVQESSHYYAMKFTQKSKYGSINSSI